MSSSRRTFVKTLAVASFGSMTLRQVVVAAAKVGKPALTNETFNRHFAALRGTPEFGQEMNEAKLNLLPYLEKRFYLTPQQIQNIRLLPPSNIRELNLALDRAVAENLTLKIAATQQNCAQIRPQFGPGTLTLELLPAVQRR